MRKFSSLLFFFMLLILSSCVGKEYCLLIEAPDDFIVGEVQGIYRAGEEVVIKTEIINGAGLNLFLDGEFLCAPKPVGIGGKYTHWEFCFKMPKKDAKVTFKIFRDEGVAEDGKIIFYDNELSEVEYEILFNYGPSDNYYDLHRRFVEESGLDELDGQVRYYQSSPYVFVFFKPEKETAQVRQFMYHLKEEHPEITSLLRKEYFRYCSIYMHNPAYYGLKKDQKVDFELMDDSVVVEQIRFRIGDILQEGIYTSSADLDKTLNALDDHKMFGLKDEVINAVKATYDDEFFEENILVVTETIVTSSGSNKQELKEIYLRGNKLNFFVKMYYVDLGTADMQYTTFVVRIPKNQINDPKNLRQELLYKCLGI